MSHRLPVIVAERPREYGAGYPAECLFAESPTTYWCTPASPAYPVVMTLEVAAADATIDRFVIDTRVKGWETSAAKHVTIEVSPPREPGAFAEVADLELALDALQHVVLASPVPAGRVRVTMHSNHGGTYLVLQRLYVMGKAVGVGEVMLPPGAHVASGQREGVVVAAGYEVRWGDARETEWVPASALRPVERPTAAAPAKAKATKRKATKR